VERRVRKDGAETVRRELDRAIFVSGFVDEDELGTYVTGVDRALEMLTGLVGSGHAAAAARTKKRRSDQASGLHQRRPGKRAKSVSFEYMSASCSSASAAS